MMFCNDVAEVGHVKETVTIPTRLSVYLTIEVLQLLCLKRMSYTFFPPIFAKGRLQMPPDSAPNTSDEQPMASRE